MSSVANLSKEKIQAKQLYSYDVVVIGAGPYGLSAGAHLKAKGLKFLGEPTVMTAGPSAGETWGYFLSPWGMNLELVSYPQGKAYQKEYKTRLWTAKDPGK